MAGFLLKKGKPTVEYFPKAASTAFAVNSLVYSNAAGEITPADSTSGDHIGVCLRVVTSGDDDYASETMVPVMIPDANTVFEAEVAGTLTTEMIGLQYDLTDADTVNVAAQSKKVVTCVGYISATKGLFKVNATIYNVNVATT